MSFRKSERSRHHVCFPGEKTVQLVQSRALQRYCFYQTQSKRELIKALCIRARMHEHCLAVMDGFKIWRYYFPSFLETNWTFIAYILKIIQSSREADVSFIEAHREVRSHRINFPVLLLPQEDVWKMPAPLNWFRNEFITWGGVKQFCGAQFFIPLVSPLFRVLIALRNQSFAPLCSSLKPILVSVLLSTLGSLFFFFFILCTKKNAFNTLGFGWLHKHSH